MESINLEIVKILDDEVIGRSLKVSFKEPPVEAWLPAEKIPPPLILEYCRQIIQRRIISTHKIYDTVTRIQNLLSVSKKEELDSLRKEFVSVNGLELPGSKKIDICITLTNMIGKPCDVNKLAEVRKDILIEKIIDKRKAQLVNMRTTEMQINVISDCQKPIKVQNDSDLKGFPPWLQYINRTIPYFEVSIACECQGNCSLSCLHFKWEELGRKYVKKEMKKRNIQPFDKHGRRNLSQIKVIIECNESCSCNESCTRRVVQKGSNVQLEIFRTFNGCGWGVRTLEDIPKGTFVMKYAGELIKWKEGNKRKNKQYLFDNDIEINPKTRLPYFTIDAFKQGNIARFMNHNCKPNLTSHLVYIDNLHPALGEIVFFAVRDIKAYEELSIKYIELVKSMNGKCKCSVCCR